MCLLFLIFLFSARRASALTLDFKTENVKKLLPKKKINYKETTGEWCRRASGRLFIFVHFRINHRILSENPCNTPYYIIK